MKIYQYITFILATVLLQLSCIHSLKLNSNILQTGTDHSLENNQEPGPFSKTFKIKFEQPFQKVPLVSIGYKQMHQTFKQNRNYTTYVQNIDKEGFEIQYITHTYHIFSAVVNWIAFDSDYGEVVDIELGEDKVGDLGQWYTRGDEHRLEFTTINFKKKYTKPPLAVSFIVGLSNTGPEWVISSKPDEITEEKLKLNMQCWHHTNTEYVKYNLLILDSSLLDCEVGEGKDYTWTEQEHRWYDHVWNNLSQINKGEDGRYAYYNYRIKSMDISTNYNKIISTGFTGYEISEGNFTLNIQDPVYYPQNSSISIEVGVHQDTQARGAWWGYLICDYDEKVQRKFSIIKWIEDALHINDLQLFVFSAVITALLTVLTLYYLIGRRYLKKQAQKIQYEKLQNQNED